MTTSQTPTVELKGLTKKFGKLEAVKKIDLRIQDGELVTLLGPSGCGKTTILRMIAGLETPTSGDIIIKGKRMNNVPIHKRNLGMIFQNYALFPHKTIFDNVAFGLKYRDVPKSEIPDRVTQALEMVRLPGVEKRKPSQLSGGQQQRIALARAIVIEPDVLLMDEPLSALDENLREEMRREIDNLQERLGLTTIFVTHDQREALSMSSRIVVMKDGVMQQEGPPEDVYDMPANYFVADFLGQSNFYPVTILSVDHDMVNVEMEDGTEVLCEQPGKWSKGEKATLNMRAQKFHIIEPGDEVDEDSTTIFSGKVADRSYMGGEVSYFVTLDSSHIEFHIISMVRTRPYKEGDKISFYILPKHCGLLKEEG